MPTPESNHPEIDPGTAAAVAGFAGLTIPDERIAAFARELAVARGYVRDLERIVVDNLAPVPGPFDPAWPGATGANR